MTRLVALGLVVPLFAAPAGAAEPGPSSEVPELAVLSHYVGTWDVTITSDDNSQIKGTARAEWVLGGRFVRQAGLLRSSDGSDETEIITLMTYDPDRKTYLAWRFMSDGTHIEAEATWNEATKTMTSVARDSAGEEVLTTTADFSTPGVERWKIVSTNKSGEELFELRGENKRRVE